MDAPLDDLMRGWRSGLRWRAPEARADTDDGGEPSDGRTLFGHFTPFDTWSEIDSYFEGNFMERTVRGAFAKTISENRASVRVLFDHGYGRIGDEPLGPIAVLREEDFGPYYEVPLLDTDWNRGTLLPLLRSEPPVLGASYRFRVIREEWNDDPGSSDHNPKGLPERTITEARLYEFGPVTFPQFPEATAKVRSLTDHYHRTSPAGRAAPDGHPTAGDAAPPADDAAPDGHLVGLAPAQRSAALRALALT